MRLIGNAERSLELMIQSLKTRVALEKPNYHSPGKFYLLRTITYGPQVLKVEVPYES